MAEIEFDDVYKRVWARELEELAEDAGVTDAAGTRAGHVSMIARLSDGTRARDGQPLELWFDPQRLQLFDPETGRSLLAGQRHTPPPAPSRTRIARPSDGVAATRHW
jgi:hypothetical protein